MDYNFDEKINRTDTNSLKWDFTDSKLPMWVADMDFNVLPDITEGIVKRAYHRVYAYSIIDDDWYDSYISWWKRIHKISLKKESLLFSTGVMPSISSIIKVLTDESDKIVIQTPVYHVFFNVILNNNRQVIENELIYENNKYRIDFESLEKQLSDSDVKLMLLCNPHNPIGKLWDKNDLKKILKLCNEYDVYLVSDEIHCDLVNPGLSYTPAFSLDKAYTENVIMCMSPTKTFNVAGLQTSAVYTENKELYDLIKNQLMVDFYSMPNVFAICGAIEAFNNGDEWVKQLNEYIYENKLIVEKFINDNNLNITFIESQATYLLWLDVSQLSLGGYEFYELLKNSYGLYVSPGRQFGDNSSDFIRLNIACPKSMLMEGLSILKEAISSIK